ncbi:asparagine synthase-related protein [Psychrobacillus sp. NEAU-3TGS]|nr:asparagine synthase-related protein [Psychrobacillus sp. NEAU-3TGS]
MTGYVTGKNTLYTNVKQIQAGEYLVFDKKNKELRTSHYFKFHHGEYSKKNQDELVEELDQVHVRVFQRLIDSLEGRPAILPLSGGYDSRLIAVMLKRLGYENVICFTYGLCSNWEVKISKMVAEQLGFKWIFVPYEKKKCILISIVRREEYTRCLLMD